MMRTKCIFVTRKSFWAIGAKILNMVDGCSHTGILHPVKGDWFVSDMTGDGFKITRYEDWVKKYRVEAILTINIENDFVSYPDTLKLIDDIALDFGPDIFKTKYAHGQLFWDGLEIIAQWFGAKEFAVKVNGKRRQVCSEWVARYYDNYGLWKGDKHFDVITLKDAYRGLCKVAAHREGEL